MPKHRGAGEGSIYQTKDGRWRGEISLGYKPDGKALRKIHYGKTRNEVSAAMKHTLRDQQLGITITSEKQTLKQFLSDWMENTVKPKNRTQTYRSYEWITRVHLIPALGHLPLQKLSPQKLQAFLNERHSTGLSATTIKHINATLRAALSQAHRWQLVPQNAAKLVTLPRSVRYKAIVLAPEQAKQLLESAAGTSDEALFTLALCIGLRRGELLGLRWCDIENGFLHVNHSLERVKKGGLRLADPKSSRAVRSLRLPQMCIASIERHREYQAKARQWAGIKWKEFDYVFTSSIGTPLQPEKVTRSFAAALKAAKLPRVRFHDLRHSCATLLLSLGVHPKLVQETLGHSTFQLTMDTYSHMIPALRNEVADRMDEIFAVPTKSPTKTERVVIQ